MILTAKNDNNVLEVTINRPEVYNALNKAAKAELAQVFQHASEDDTVKAIVFTASGKAFCSGQDLTDRVGEKRDLGETLKTEWNPLAESMHKCKKIIVTALNGVAAGAGMALVFNSDIVVAKNTAKLVSGFCQIGLIPDSGASFLLPRILGYQRAMSFSLLNQALNAEELVKFGIAVEVAADEVSRARQIAAQLASMPTLALTELKKNYKKGLESSYGHMLDVEVESQRKMGFTHDFEEGVKAFLEKRPAKFIGR